MNAGGSNVPFADVAILGKRSLRTFKVRGLARL